MKKEKKKKHDLVPDIYMLAAAQNAYLSPGYPMDSGQGAMGVVPIPMLLDLDDDGDTRVDSDQDLCR